MGRDRPVYDSYPHPVYGVIGFVGESFQWGAVGGAAFHFARSLRGAPGGAGRLAGAVRAACASAPRVAGTFGAYCAAFSVVETAVCLASGSQDMWCSVSAAAAVWGMRGMRQGGGAAAAGGALLSFAGTLAFYGVDHFGMVWLSRRADADYLLRQKKMMDRGQPTPVALAASRTAVPTNELAVQMLCGKYE